MWQGYAALDAGWFAKMRAARGDVLEGLRRWRSWSYLAVETVKNQYRRTVLGPWWITLQTAMYIVGLALLFGTLLKQDLSDFLPYVAVGLIGFNLLAGLTRRGAEAFVSSAGAIRSTRQPLSNLLFRGMAIEVIQFGHNMLIFAAFVALGYVPVSLTTLLAVPVVLVIMVNGVAVGMWLGPMVARFRDVGPLVTSVLQVMIFFTPVFWQIDSLHPDARTAILAWNPFAYLLGALREPLLGSELQALSYLGTLVITVVNVIIGTWVFVQTRSRLPYWVA